MIFYICIGCGKDTTARGEICKACYSDIPQDRKPMPNAWEVDTRDDYEKEIDETYGLDRPLGEDG